MPEGQPTYARIPDTRSNEAWSPTPQDYRWSSFNHYVTGEPGLIEIESDWTFRHPRTRLTIHRAC